MKNTYKIRFLIALVVFALAILAFCGIVYPVKIMDLQLAPLLQRVIVDFSIISAILLGGILLLTLLCGRIYCSTICPLGILQEFVDLVKLKFRKNKCTKTPNLPVKYFIAAITWGLIIGGSAVAVRYFDPYTLFGSAITLSIVGIVAVVLVFVAVILKDRVFCTNICPVGTVLGLLSKISLNKIFISDICVSCGVCEKNCPSGCINSKEKTVDNEACIKCLKCLEVCPKQGIKLGQAPASDVKFNIKRRQIIIATAAIALFGGMVKAGMTLKDTVVQKLKDIILPPGAGNTDEMANKCYNCNLCANNCPNKIIVKANDKCPTVHLDYSQGEGFCKSDCNNCGKACPTGAIKRLTLEEKQKTRIAMAMINSDKCSKCSLCVETCPYGAIEKINNQIQVNGSKCVGCGACKKACHFGAIEIFSIKQQSKTL